MPQLNAANTKCIIILEMGKIYYVNKNIQLVNEKLQLFCRVTQSVLCFP